LFSRLSAIEVFASEFLTALVFPSSDTAHWPHAFTVAPFFLYLDQSKQFGRTQSAPSKMPAAFVFRLPVCSALHQANSTTR